MNKLHHNKLLIIAGTGRNSGKTTLACMIIEKFRNQSPVAIKISPHFHEPGEGLEEILSGNNYRIYRETVTKGNKDTSRMLRSGAVQAIYIQVYDEHVAEAFGKATRDIPADIPVVCESPSLGRHIKSGMLFIADNENIEIKKDISSLLRKPDRTFYPLTAEPDISNLAFSSGTWTLR